MGNCQVNTISIHPGTINKFNDIRPPKWVALCFSGATPWAAAHLIPSRGERSFSRGVCIPVRLGLCGRTHPILCHHIPALHDPGKWMTTCPTIPLLTSAQPCAATMGHQLRVLVVCKAPCPISRDDTFPGGLSHPGALFQRCTAKVRFSLRCGAWCANMVH